MCLELSSSQRLLHLPDDPVFRLEDSVFVLDRVPELFDLEELLGLLVLQALDGGGPGLGFFPALLRLGPPARLLCPTSAGQEYVKRWVVWARLVAAFFLAAET